MDSSHPRLRHVDTNYLIKCLDNHEMLIEAIEKTIEHLWDADSDNVDVIGDAIRMLEQAVEIMKGE